MKINNAICFITDDNYLLPTMIAIKSLLINKRFFSKYNIIVISHRLSENSKTALRIFNRNIKVIEVELDNKLRNTTTNGRHVSTTALIKFMLPGLLPQYDKVLYLDSDILVLKDLGELLNLQLDNHYAAAVESYSAPLLKVNPLEHLQVTHYFNTGVMLLNLKEMRINNIQHQLSEYRLNGWNHYMDQDTFNAVFDDNAVLMPITFNLMYTSTYRFTCNHLCDLYGIPREENYNSLCNKSTILHFSSAEKPWLYDNTWKSDLWMSYYNKLPKKIKDRYPLDRLSLKRPMFDINGNTPM